MKTIIDETLSCLTFALLLEVTEGTPCMGLAASYPVQHRHTPVMRPPREIVTPQLILNNLLLRRLTRLIAEQISVLCLSPCNQININHTKTQCRRHHPGMSVIDLRRSPYLLAALAFPSSLSSAPERLDLTARGPAYDDTIRADIAPARWSVNHSP